MGLFTDIIEKAFEMPSREEQFIEAVKKSELITFNGKASLIQFTEAFGLVTYTTIRDWHRETKLITSQDAIEAERILDIVIQ